MYLTSYTLHVLAMPDWVVVCSQSNRHVGKFSTQGNRILIEFFRGGGGAEAMVESDTDSA